MEENEIKVKKVKKLMDIKKGLEESQDDTTPYLANNEEGDMHIIGDPNKTETIKSNYRIGFRVPKNVLEKPPIINGEEIKEEFGQYTFAIEFKDVFLNPRKDAKLVAEIMKMAPYFKKVNEETGDVTELTQEESIEIFANMTDKTVDAMYSIIATFLEIQEELVDYMMSFTVLDAMYTMIKSHPNVFNESDIFLG